MALQNNAKKPTQEEVKKNLKLQRREFDKRYKKLLARLTALESEKHVYTKDSKVEISGSLFADFINTIAYSKQYLERVKGVLSMAETTIEGLLDQNAQLTLDLMDAHVNNIESGITEKREIDTPVTQE
jgi:hypothetical protein